MPDSSHVIKVLIVDDHPVFRRGIADALEDQPDLEVVAQAGNGREALALVAEHQPDVLVTDVDMPEMNGLELLTSLLKETPTMKTVILTMHREELYLREAIDLGVLAYVMKDDSIDGVVEGVKAASRGQSYISPSLASVVMQRNAQAESRSSELAAIGTLTPAERTVLKLVARNRMSKEIASELGISPRTVSAHRNNISKKLGLVDKMPLLNWALLHQNEILEQDG